MRHEGHEDREVELLPSDTSAAALCFAPLRAFVAD